MALTGVADAKTVVAIGRMIRARNEVDKKRQESLRRAATERQLPRFMYTGEVIHVGGEGSRTVTKNAYNGPNARNTEAYLDARRLVFVSFNRGGDLAWIGCAKGFTVTKCTSSTGNEVEIDQDMGCMLMFNTKMKSVATVNCVRRE